MGFEGMFTVDPIRRSGGLAFFWKHASKVEIINYSPRHICAKITQLNSDFAWKFMGFYGHPDRAQRADSWRLLNHLSTFDPPDWLCCGDFNEITDLSEKYWGDSRPAPQMRGFRDSLISCGLGDLGYKGAKYTWSNQRPSSAFVKEGLDRALATSGWCRHFPEVSVTVLPTQSSDHLPLWIQMQDSNTIRKQPRNFKFEASWNVDEESAEISQNTWQGGMSKIVHWEKYRLC
jgi:hypothetical protein